MVIAIVIIGALAAAIGALFLYGLRGEPNEPPALGSNFPYPWGVARGPIVGEDERDRDDADSRLAAEERRRHHERRLSSD